MLDADVLSALATVFIYTLNQLLNISILTGLIDKKGDFFMLLFLYLVLSNLTFVNSG